MLGQTGAVLAALFLAFDPFLLALSRVWPRRAGGYLSWLSLLAFLRAHAPFLDPGAWANPEPQGRPAVPARPGGVGRAGLLDQVPSLFLGAFVAGTLLVLYIGRGGDWRQVFRNGLASVLLWSLAAGLVFCVLWPAMWVDPLGRVAAIINDALRASGSPHPKGSFFLGQPVPDPGMGFYVLVSLFRTTPLIWLGWALLLVNMALGRMTTSQSAWLEKPGRRVVLILLAYALLYGVLVTVGGKKQDCYILPAFPVWPHWPLWDMLRSRISSAWRPRQVNLRSPSSNLRSQSQLAFPTRSGGPGSLGVAPFP
jgi:hypothetical protein